MQGRLENEMKIFKTADALMESMPSFANEWYMNMKASRKTASSCYDYSRKIRRFLEYVSDDIKNMNANEITLQACESYLISCQTKVGNDGLETFTSDSYQQTIWSALNYFLGFLAKRNYIEYNFMQDISCPKVRDLDRINRERVLLTQKDFNKILNAAKNGSDYMQGLLNNRDVLIILLFMTTGIRKTALTSINIEDIDIKECTLSVVDKGNKIHIYNLNEQTINYLKKWLRDREKVSNEKSGSALFIGKSGERLTDKSIGNIVENCCYKGIGKKLSPHKLRSGFCSILYNKTHDIEFVRKVVGHSRIATTQRYIKTSGDEREKAVKIMSDILNI